MQRSTRDHRKLPPPSTIPSDGYPSSPRDYDMMTKGSSRYEHGPGYAHRGGYGLPEHRDKVINPSQYQNRFEVLEPHQGRNDIRLPGIEALDKLSHQDNRPPTSGRDTAGRIPQKQNTHRMEAQSESRNIDTRAKPDTQGKNTIIRRFQILMIPLVYAQAKDPAIGAGTRTAS